MKQSRSLNLELRKFMSGNFILKIIFRVLFGVIASYQLKVYYDSRNIVQSSNPIDYIYVDEEIKKGGRGVSYEMEVLYKDKQYELNITKKMFEEIKVGKFPVLYYYKEKDTVFSLWEIKKSFRVTILFFIGFLLTFIPKFFIKK